MSRARTADRPELGEFVTQARTKFARVPARKVRAVADLIRGLTVGQAREQLAFLHRPSAEPLVRRALLSAAANARENHEIGDPDDLIVGEIFADGGPTLKRFRAAAMGRGVSIRKRTAHLTIRLYAQPE